MKLFDNKLSFAENFELLQKKAIKAFSGHSVDTNTRLIDNIICFVGSSGGVGTTTIVANLAYSVAQTGLSVAVVDLNVEYPNLHTLFGIKTRLKQPDLVSFINGRNELGKSLVFSDKVGLLFPANRNMMDRVNTDKEIHAKNLGEGITRLGKLFDLVLVDCNRDVGYELVNTAFYIADKIYAVMDDGINSISNYTRLIKNMGIVGIDSNKVNVVLGKRTSVHYYMGALRDLEVDKVPVMLPFELGVIESGLRGELYCKKGASGSSTGDIYNKEMKNLMHYILESSGMYQSSRQKPKMSALVNMFRAGREENIDDNIEVGAEEEKVDVEETLDIL